MAYCHLSKEDGDDVADLWTRRSKDRFMAMSMAMAMALPHSLFPSPPNRLIPIFPPCNRLTPHSTDRIPSPPLSIWTFSHVIWFATECKFIWLQGGTASWEEGTSFRPLPPTLWSAHFSLFWFRSEIVMPKNRRIKKLEHVVSKDWWIVLEEQ